MIVKSVVKAKKNNRAIEQLYSEAQFTFNSPLLQSSLTLIEDPSAFFLIKDYFVGVPLPQFWKGIKTKDKFNCAKEFVAKTVPVFDALQKSNVVHADIKPSNFIVSVNPNGKIDSVKLIDFGLSFFTDHVPNRKTLFPLGFSAPELILNRLNLANHATDLYAFGTLLFVLLEGRIPHIHQNPSIAINLQINLPLPKLSRRYSNLYPLIEKLTYKYCFEIPPHQMPKEKMDSLLTSAINQRFQNLEAFYTSFKTVKMKGFLK